MRSFRSEDAGEKCEAARARHEVAEVLALGASEECSGNYERNEERGGYYGEGGVLHSASLLE